MSIEKSLEEVSSCWTKNQMRDKLKWFGIKCQQWPTDLASYQELIFSTKPEIIIETGTRFGGLTYFLLIALKEIDKNGKIVTVDICDERDPKVKSNPDIIFLKGNSVSTEIVSKITEIVKGKRILVILDSNHSTSHVLEELKNYAPLVQKDGVIIVNDTTMGYPERWQGRESNRVKDSPRQAVEEYLKDNLSFTLVKPRIPYGLSLNIQGIIKRVK